MVLNPERLRKKRLRKRKRREAILEARIALYGSKSKPSHGWKTALSSMPRMRVVIPKKTMWQRIKNWLKNIM